MCSRSLFRRSRLRRGAVAPLTAISLMLLVAVMALAIDGGTLMEARRHVQAAADAAALAGAIDLYTNYPANQGYDYNGTAAASAQYTASANGFTDGTQSSVIVTVRTSPQSSQTYQSGPDAGQVIPPGYIEVLIQYNTSPLFSGIFGSAATPVRARAVARGLTSNNLGILALSLYADGALNVPNRVGLTVNGGLQINSASPRPFEVASTAKVTATLSILNPTSWSFLKSIDPFLLGPGGSSPTVVPAPPIGDPLRYLPIPNPAQLGLNTYINTNITSGTVPLYPGYYKGGIRIGYGAKVILHANSDGTPGIYYLEGGGFQVSGSSSITTVSGEAGIMIFNNWSSLSDTVNINTTGAVTIAPPISGPYRGLSIFQNPGTFSNMGPPITLNALGNFNLTGTIYAPYAQVALSASSSTNVMGGQIIADTVSAGGYANININPNGQPTANWRILGLVQ